jgi:uncharacterized membrane protein
MPCASRLNFAVQIGKMLSVLHPGISNPIPTCDERGNGMSTPIGSIACFLAAALLGALGQYLYKSGADQAGEGIMSYVWNARLLGGVACYIAVMVLFVAAFKQGGELSVLYPIYATTFIFAALLAYWAYGTPIKPINIAGMACLILGMFLMGKS